MQLLHSESEITRKIRKYLVDTQGQCQDYPKASDSFQRRRYLQENMLSRGNDQKGSKDQEKVDDSLSLVKSKAADTHLRDEKNSMQLYIDYLQERLFKQTETIILLRNDLDECNNRVKLQTTLINSIHTLACSCSLECTDQNCNQMIETESNEQAQSSIIIRNLRMSTRNSINSPSSSRKEFREHGHNARRKPLLTSFMLRLFGPCARCDDPNHRMEDSRVTYTVEDSS